MQIMWNSGCMKYQPNLLCQLGTKSGIGCFFEERQWTFVWVKNLCLSDKQSFGELKGISRKFEAYPSDSYFFTFSQKQHMIYCIEGLLEIDEYTKYMIFSTGIIEQLFGKTIYCVICADFLSIVNFLYIALYFYYKRLRMIWVCS